MKVVDLSKFKKQEESKYIRQLIINEACLLRFVGSEHLIHCHEVYEYGNHIWMVIDYMNWGS